MEDFESIYRDYFGDVFRYLRSLTLDESRAEDLTQETFLRAMRSLSSFRGECEVRVWLCRIAKNLIAGFYLAQNNTTNTYVSIIFYNSIWSYSTISTHKYTVANFYIPHNIAP